jgi:hypothetical protein
MEALAMLPFTLAVDFSGDHWTFFKPQLTEIRDLYGVNIQEMSLWRSLLEHCCEHLPHGRLVSVEVDAYWLPDTQATDYRKQHTKTTIAVAELDPEKQILGYFHNTAYHQLSGEDFRQIFRIDIETPADYLFPYSELIHLDNVVQHSQEKLVEISYGLLQRYAQLIPSANPLISYAERFKKELPVMQQLGLAYYHQWAFNNTRQLGAAFELAAAYLQWLTAAGVADFSASIASFEKISTDNKSLILKVARAVNTNKPLDLTETYRNMASDWDQGMHNLRNKITTI